MLLAGIYLIAQPPSADLAAAAHRSNIFAAHGFLIWDNGWYAGQALPAYSLLSPELGAWLGLRILLALSALLASLLYGSISARLLSPRAARASTIAFAFGFCAELPSGRVPYDLGAAIGLGAVLSMLSGPPPLTFALAALTSLASPVAGAFLAMCGLALFLASPGSRGRQGLALCVASLAPILLLAAAFPNGGSEPFAPGAFWPELIAAVAVAGLLPRGSFSAQACRVLRVGAALYALALAGSFLIPTPMGGNAARLGEMFGPPLVLAAVWDPHAQRSSSPLLRTRRVRLATLALLLPALLYWQLATSIKDQIALAGDPTVHASFYEPLRHELLTLAKGSPIRVEVPLTGAHWESAYLPGGPISIARGWDRQLDIRYARLFYEPHLTASAYRRWLSREAISYVALPYARLDAAGEQEAHLIEAGLPYLHELWRARRWRLFAVLDATPLVQRPATMRKIGVDSFTIQVRRPGAYLVHLHWTPYWAPAQKRVCIERSRNGLTIVRARRTGLVRVQISFSLGRVFASGPRCLH